MCGSAGGDLIFFLLLFISFWTSSTTDCFPLNCFCSSRLSWPQTSQPGWPPTSPLSPLNPVLFPKQIFFPDDCLITDPFFCSFPSFLFSFYEHWLSPSNNKYSSKTFLSHVITLPCSFQMISQGLLVLKPQLVRRVFLMSRHRPSPHHPPWNSGGAEDSSLDASASVHFSFIWTSIATQNLAPKQPLGLCSPC